MSPQSAVAGDGSAAGYATARRVLVAVRTAERPPTVEDLSLVLGLHPNTVRQHVAALEADGLLERDRRPTGGRGRPRAVFRTTPRGERSGWRNYELLARVLVERLASRADDARAEARAAGREWGALLADDREPRPGEVQSLVYDVLTEGGFEPLASPGSAADGSLAEIALRNCPFRELADSRGDVVCTVHEGILQGIVQGPSARGPHVELLPRVTPTSCLVRLTRL